jgi:hypothetical protein
MMRLTPHIFDDADQTNWRDARYWLCYTLIGGLAPIWCGYIILKVLSHHATMGQFTEHGEFALYTAAIVAPAFHTLGRDLKIPGFRGRQFLLLVSVCCMLLAVCVYVAVSSAYMSTSLPNEINQAFLAYGTVVLFILSTGLAFCVTVLDYARLSSDPRAVLDGQREELKKDFTHLQGEEHQ